MSREKALKRINEYLAKQEPQKVELAAFENEKNKFKIKAKQVFKEEMDATAKFRDAVDEIRNIKKEVNLARKSLDSLIRKSQKAKSAFKEVGIEAPSYLDEIDGKGFLAWENDLIESSQNLNRYVK
tara:strand:+ start:113 stop:490 length:378 start_codon:yes stop_codon:yes gene_type:complete